MDQANPQTRPSPSHGTKARRWYRLHASTYVVLLVAATVLFLLNVPGQYVPYVGVPFNELMVDDPRLVRDRLEHGWPFTYLIRDDRFLVDRPGETGYRPTAIWSFTEDLVSFDGWRLLGNVLAALFVIGSVALLAEYWRRQRHSVWQLRVSDLLGLTAIIACGIWYTLSTLHEYERELAAMRKLGLTVAEDGEPTQFLPNYSHLSFGGPTWLRELLGDRFPRVFDRLIFAEVPQLDLDFLEQLKAFKRLKGICVIQNPGPLFASMAKLRWLEAIHVSADTTIVHVVGDEAYWSDADADDLDKDLARYLRKFADLPRLRAFGAEGDGVGDLSVKAMAGFPRLRILRLSHSRVTVEGLKALGQCETLEELYLRDTTIGDDGLIHLQHLPRLRVLDLYGCRLTDAAVESLAKLTTLRRLHLDPTNLDGKSLPKLANLSHLEFLSLPEYFDHKAVKELQRRMPSLKIEIGGKEFVGEEY